MTVVTDQLLHELEAIYRSAASNKAFQQRAWQAFADAPFPTKKVAAFRYLPLKKLKETTFELSRAETVPESVIAPSVLAESKDAYCVFINGRFCPKLSKIPAEVVALPLAEARHSYGSFLDKQEAMRLDQEDNPFAHLNTALSSEGLFLYFAPETTLLTPLQLLFVETATTGLILPRIEVCMGKKSRATLVAQTISPEKTAHWTNAALYLAVEERAVVSFLEEHAEPATGWRFSAVRATLKRESHFSYFACSRGSKPVLYRDLSVRLIGERATAAVKGIELVSQKDEAHSQVSMYHEAPNTDSDQQIKAIAADRARVGFAGKIFVAQKAQQTDAYQLNHNLILDEHAVAYSQPNLEVFADDVKASHGATCSRPSVDEQFYLRTRGISRSVSEQLLVRAFCRDLLDAVPVQSLRKRCEKAVDYWLDQRKR
ncbi:MAG: SufD family Fe-S cluster assembly protein [Chlamydiota bacterium]